MQRFPCPCCGYRTLARPAEGSTDFCPVCFWENGRWVDRDVTLTQAQRNFARYGTCEAHYRGDTRAPFVEEARAPDWQSIDERRARLVADIEAAFDGVSRAGGVSLHETQVLDLYGTQAEREAARRKDREQRWQDVSAADLDEVGGIGGFSFFDLVGWRYYLPAYLRRYLDGGARGCRVLSTLTLGAKPDLREKLDLPCYRMLSPAQARVVRAFLEFVVEHEDNGHERRDARKALERYWSKVG